MSEHDGYNFQQLKRAILALSVSQDWETAKKGVETRQHV